MKLSPKAKSFHNQIDGSTKLGDLRKFAKEIGKDHAVAMELWSTGEFLPRQLAILVMDPKQLSQEVIDKLDKDMHVHREAQQNHLIDWLLANQFSKDKKLTALMLTWQNSKSVLQRRTFWYHQARLRWVGQTPPPNTEELLSVIEKEIMKEHPSVQWAMNFLAGQIGIFQPEYRERCIALGELTGLYRDEVVAKNCTPSYLPKFIEIQVAKMKK